MKLRSITEMENLLEELSGRLEMAKERIDELGDR